MSFRIRVDADSLRFAAGHFATFGGDLEPVHGHNYRVTAELAGLLTEESWVMDFGVVKETLREICGRLDHKFLLQSDSRSIGIEATGDEYTLTFAERRYVMPVGDVCALPVDNITAERLAEWIASELVRTLMSQHFGNVTSVTVGVEEAPGQSAWFTQSL
jgi:6-pyruvoyltetrahydropterin/6-carboxytetrahydropterin synthase